MKITGTGTPAGAPPEGASAPKGPAGPEGTAGTEAPAKAERERSTDKKGATETSGRTFAETLAAGRPGSAPAPTAGSKAPASVHALTSDIASDLKAGRIDAKAALDRVVERVLDQQLGKNAPAALRDQLREALHDTISSDPFLTDRLRGLS